MKKPNFKLTIPKLLKKVDFETNNSPMTRAELYQVSHDFNQECGVLFGITGSFALELHASKLNTPIHRMVHDVDFMVKDIAVLSLKMAQSEKFDIAKSSLDSGEDNAWIVHKETGFLVDVVQAGHKFGPLRGTDIEIINGLPVVPRATLETSLMSRGEDTKGDLKFLQSLQGIAIDNTELNIPLDGQEMSSYLASKNARPKVEMMNISSFYSLPNPLKSEEEDVRSTSGKSDNVIKKRQMVTK